MPCYEPREYGPVFSTNAEAEAEIKRLHAKLSESTNLLCWLCRRVDPDLINNNLYLSAWWRKHEAFDKSEGR